MKLLVDVHCHVMTLARPAITPFLAALGKRGLEALYSQVAAPGYLLMSLFRRGTKGAGALLAVMENDPAGLLGVVEDDLRGVFRVADSPPAVAEGSPAGIDFFGQRMDRWLLAPLVMDFSREIGARSDDYYARPPRKPLREAVLEMLAGIARYRRERPDGLLVVRPFLGIDPAAHGPTETEALLDRYFSGFERGRKAQLSAFHRTQRWSGDPERPPANAFAGVKLYPPLGFHPWPREPSARDAVSVLYRFCEPRGIPLTVHCDDQGYRSVGIEEALQATDPAAWAPVFAEHPDLVVDFAHFGERYLPPGQGETPDSWTRAIVGLMRRLPGVYADVSFNGSDPAYWNRLARFLDDLTLVDADEVRKRLLFGTDFFLNLTKTRSYLDYVRGFMDGPLDRELVKAMMTTNPERFLFGE